MSIKSTVFAIAAILISQVSAQAALKPTEDPFYRGVLVGVNSDKPRTVTLGKLTYTFVAANLTEPASNPAILVVDVASTDDGNTSTFVIEGNFAHISKVEYRTRKAPEVILTLVQNDEIGKPKSTRKIAVRFDESNGTLNFREIN